MTIWFEFSQENMYNGLSNSVGQKALQLVVPKDVLDSHETFLLVLMYNQEKTMSLSLNYFDVI